MGTTSTAGLRGGGEGDRARSFKGWIFEREEGRRVQGRY